MAIKERKIGKWKGKWDDELGGPVIETPKQAAPPRAKPTAKPRATPKAKTTVKASRKAPPKAPPAKVEAPADADPATVMTVPDTKPPDSK